MKEVLAVFIGGGSGSVLRYYFSRWLSPLFGLFPFSTFLANFMACLIFGIVMGVTFEKAELQEPTKKLLLVGFCGGLSTFSTFNFELFNLIKSGNILMAFIYLILSISLCFIGFWTAMEICK